MAARYRFVRIAWGKTKHMSAELDAELSPHEEVVSHSADKDEVLVLVKAIPPKDTEA